MITSNFPDFNQIISNSLTFPGFPEAFSNSLTFPGIPGFPGCGTPCIWNRTELGLVSKQSEECGYNPNLDVIWNQTELGLVSKQSEKCDYNPNLDVLIVLCGDCKYIINESKILPLNAPRFNYLIQLLQNTTVKIIKRRYRIELVYVHVNRRINLPALELNAPKLYLMK